MLSGMRRPIMVRPLLDAERTQVKAGLRSSAAFTVRRCQILLASAAGQTAPQIAAALRGSDQPVRTAIPAFHQHGLASLSPGSARPHPIQPAFPPLAAERLRPLLPRSPRAFGPPTRRWTLDRLADGSVAHGLTTTRVSGEPVRATLARQGIPGQRATRWSTSPDPQDAHTPAAVTACAGWRSSPQRGCWAVPMRPGGAGWPSRRCPPGVPMARRGGGLR
jgi:Winged helix-turn helix